MGTGNMLSISNVDNVHHGANNMFHFRASLSQRVSYDRQYGLGLNIDIAI